MKTRQYQTRKKASRWKRSRNGNEACATTGPGSAQDRMFQELLGPDGRDAHSSRDFPRDNPQKRRFQKSRDTRPNGQQPDHSPSVRHHGRDKSQHEPHVRQSNGRNDLAHDGIWEGSEIGSPPNQRLASPVVLVGGDRPEAVQALMTKLFDLGFPTCGPVQNFLAGDFIRAFDTVGMGAFEGCAIAVPSDHPYDRELDTGRGPGCVAVWVGQVNANHYAGKCYDWLRNAARGRILRMPPPSMADWGEQAKSLSRFLNYQFPEC